MPEQNRTIVFLAQGFSEPGGCAAHGRKIAEELASRGWTVHVIARKASGARIRRTAQGRIVVTEVPGFNHRAIGGVLFLLIAVPLAVLRRPPAVYIAFQLSATASVGSVAASIHRKRLLVLSTMTGESGEVAFVRASRFAGLRRALLSRASVLVAQTPDGAAELRGLLPQRPVAVVPTPVRIPHQVPALSGAPTATFTGRLVRQKNLPGLLEVWRRIVRSRPDARLVLVGEGAPGDPTEGEVRAALAKEPALGESVAMTGWVDDVEPYLREADVFVFPTHFEGMSNALLEACALGRVIVASDIEGNRAVLGADYPLLFRAGDVDAFERVMQTAFSSEAVREEARARALERVRAFDISRVGAALETLIVG